MDTLPELMSFLDGLTEPHILINSNYQILAANQAYQKLYSPQASVVGQTCYGVSHRFTRPCDQAGESCPLSQARQSGHCERVLHLHHSSAGQEYVNIELTPLKNSAGELAYFVEKMAAAPFAHSKPRAKGLIGSSSAFQQMLVLVARAAPSTATVLLLGESGTGKELVAQAVHTASPRARKPLVVVECASLPENLFESELFGHEKGAFTGATVARAGLVEAASGGTLFLDEVGDIPLTMQVKLLRLLETGTYRRVGSTELNHADIRVVAATHKDIFKLMQQGLFREDLYFRLGVFPIRLPPLRERKDDIPSLSKALLARISDRKKYSLSAQAQDLLQSHDFPGNIRELRNILERASLLADSDLITHDHIQLALASAYPGHVASSALKVEHAPVLTEKKPQTTNLREAQKEAFSILVAGHQGSRAELARRLGISERTLYRKLKGA
ncbi:MAG: sigma-54-dependent Fis family transcriptional regulator [Rhodoferax sp.]|nr:MAG: sigma-54-dependent Fis family transcriptional regulator [Rhodoferax sp.]